MQSSSCSGVHILTAFERKLYFPVLMIWSGLHGDTGCVVCSSDGSRHQHLSISHSGRQFPPSSPLDGVQIAPANGVILNKSRSWGLRYTPTTALSVLIIDAFSGPTGRRSSIRSVRDETSRFTPQVIKGGWECGGGITPDATSAGYEDEIDAQVRLALHQSAPLLISVSEMLTKIFQT